TAPWPIELSPLAKVQGACWGNYNGHSAIGESSVAIWRKSSGFAPTGITQD
ncbi:unnamed protein product, partial [Adineta steineri]